MEQTICIFGSSITWGAWDKDKGGWVNRLRLFFERKYDDIFVYNLRISADNSRGLLKRIQIECEARNPTIIIVSIGVNDSAKNSYVYVPLEEFQDNLIKIIKTAKRFTLNITLLGTENVDEKKTRPVSWNKTINYLNKELMEYDDVIQKVSKKEKVHYLKMSGLLTEKDLADGLHPNINGHKKIFSSVKNFIIEKFIPD